MKITVCVGSSCHLKGSAHIVEKLENLIASYSLADKIELNGTFCLERCNRDGVTLKVDDEIYAGVKPEEAEEFFEKHVLSVMK